VRARDLARTQGSYDVHRLADEALKTLAPRVPKLVVELPKDVRGAEVRVDGRRAESSSSIALDPGRHDLVVTAPRRDPFVRALALEEGQTLRVAVSFRDRAAPVRARQAPDRPLPRREQPTSSGPPIGSLLLAGVGAAAFTSAALLHIRRNDKLDEAGAGCDQADGEFVCPASRKSDPEHRDLIDAADRAELARDVLIGVGVGAWTAGALVWIFDRGKTEERVSAAVTPEPHGASARVRLRF
jgi:hypothetical protein